MRDWLAWHEGYDDPASPLSRRLAVVQQRLGRILDRPTATLPVILSLCAGDGRDVIPVLAARAATTRPAAVLVETNQALADRADAAAAAACLESVEVRCRDAGDPASFQDVLPVDVLLVCGIFGNIPHTAVKDVVDALPVMLAGDGHVIWTRGTSDPDRRPEIRRWFEAAGLEEVAFDGAPEPFGVGVNKRAPMPPGAGRGLPARLFTFL